MGEKLKFVGRLLDGGMIGYSFKNHDALEDAKTTGHTLLAASAKTGLDIEG